MKKNTKQKKWEKEFFLIKDRKDFLEFYMDIEDKWLQYSDWNKKIKGIFGSYKNAVKSFNKAQRDMDIIVKTN